MSRVWWYSVTGVVNVTVLMTAPPPPRKHETLTQVMLTHRLRCWPNIYPTLGRRIVSAGPLYVM